MAQIRIGTSGFSYHEWKGLFYPRDLSSKQFLRFYSQHFSTAEINNTFYRLPTSQLTSSWYREVPDNFSFTLKLSQRITHIKKLKNVREEMERFLEAASGLKEKQGPVLVQLPPAMGRNDEVLEEFLSRYADRAQLAFEFRHDSWFTKEVYDLLNRYSAAFGVVETEEREAIREVTGDFIYMRMRKGEYSPEEIGDWIRWMKSQQKDVYCYIKHDECAPLLAQQFLSALK